MRWAVLHLLFIQVHKLTLDRLLRATNAFQRTTGMAGTRGVRPYALHFTRIP